MDGNDTIKFPLSGRKKRGLALTIFFTALFGVMAVWLSHFLHFGYGRFALGLLGVCDLLAALFFVFSYIKLAKEKFAAISISGEGINEGSTGSSIGMVRWEDVKEIKVMNDVSNLKHRYLVLLVYNPDEYINREKSREKRRSLQLKYQYYGSPACFSDRALDISFEVLRDAVMRKYKDYKDIHPLV